MQVLIEDASFVLDEEGRRRYRFRLVYRVDSQAAVASWSRVSRSWRSWFQNRPTVRARHSAHMRSGYNQNGLSASRWA